MSKSENSDSQEILSSEPLGNNSPLLPQFLVPLGAQSISVLQPKIFSPKLIDDFSTSTFEDSPFFDEFHPPDIQQKPESNTPQISKFGNIESSEVVTQRVSDIVSKSELDNSTVEEEFTTSDIQQQSQSITPQISKFGNIESSEVIQQRVSDIVSKSELDYSTIGTVEDSPLTQDLIQLSPQNQNPVVDSQTTIPTQTQENQNPIHSDIGTVKDSLQTQDLIQLSPQTQNPVVNSQINIPSQTRDNQNPINSDIGTVNDLPQTQDLIQPSPQNQNPIHSDIGTVNDSPPTQDLIQRSPQNQNPVVNSQINIPSQTQNNQNPIYSDIGTENDSPATQDLIQRSPQNQNSVVDSQTTIPNQTQENQNPIHSDIGTVTDSSSTQDLIQLSPQNQNPVVNSQTTIPNQTDIGTVTDSSPTPSQIQLSPENTSSSNTSVDENSLLSTDTNFPENQSIIQPFSETNISEDSAYQKIQKINNDYEDNRSVKNTEIIQTSTDTETTIQQSSEKKLPQLPTVLQNLGVLDSLATQSSTKVNQSSPNTIHRTAQEPKIQPTSTVPDAFINNSGWSDFNQLVQGQTTPTKILREKISQNNSKNADTRVQAKSLDNIPTVRVFNQHSKNKSQTQVDKTTDNKALDSLAIIVYEQLKQRLRIEQERHGSGYRNRNF